MGAEQSDRAGTAARPVRVRGGRGADIFVDATDQYRVRNRVESVCAEVEFRAATRGCALRGHRRRDALQQYRGTTGNLAREFHNLGSSWGALPAQQVQLERGSAVHAYIERGAGDAQPGNQHDSGAHWVWAVHAAAVKRFLAP